MAGKSVIFSHLYPVAECNSITFSRHFFLDGVGNHRPIEHIFTLFEIHMEIPERLPVLMPVGQDFPPIFSFLEPTATILKLSGQEEAGVFPS